MELSAFNSEDPLTPFDNVTLEALNVKHPFSSQLLYFSPSTFGGCDVLSSGYSRSRVQGYFVLQSVGHLKVLMSSPAAPDMISDSAGSAGPMLLRALTAFVNRILQGRAPLPVRPPPPLFFICSAWPP